MPWERLLIFLCILPFCSNTVSAQSGTCSGAEVFCGSNAYSFPTSVSTQAEPGPCYSEPGCGGSWPVTCACLTTAPNPAWYFMQAGSTGEIIITMTGRSNGDPPEDLDIDFICWGPFTSPTGACPNGLTCDKVVSCSYSGDNDETCIIPNAIAGEFYMLLITNFSNQPGNITFQQANVGQPGAGTTNCNIVVECSMLALSPVPTTCDEMTATFDLNGVVEFTNPPATGSLIIKDATAVPPIQISLNPPFVSPMNYTIPDIPCDGLVHDLHAMFTEAGNPCELTTTYQAPVAPCPSGIMSGGGDICDDGISQSTVSIAVTGAAGPYNFEYAIDGVAQLPVNNYAGPIPYVITTSTPGVYSLISTSNGTCAGLSTGSATVTLVPIPDPPQPAGTVFFRCGAGEVILTLDDIPGRIINWYNSPTGGTPLFTGNPFTTPSIGTSTTYYAESETVIAGCRSTSRTAVTAEVRSIPVLSGSTSLSVCSDAPWSIPLQSLPEGASFSWTASSTPPGAVSGFITPNSGETLNDLLANITGAVAQVSYLITPSLNQCDGAPSPIVITVNPNPVPTFTVSSQEVCSGAQNVIYTTQTGMSDYLWNISGGGTIQSGGTSHSVEVAWTIPGSGDERWIEVSYTDNNGCTTENPTRLNITVKPIPDIVIIPPFQTICNGGTATIQFESQVPGTLTNTTFSWSLSAPANVSPNSLSGNGQIDQVFQNNGNEPFSVTFSVTANAAGCTSQQISDLVTVNPKPSVIFSSAIANPQQVCSGSVFISVPLQSSVTTPGTTYHWTASAFDPINPTNAITGFTSPNNSEIAIPGENIVSSLLTQGEIRYTVIPVFEHNGQQCPGDPGQYTVLVNPSPTVVLTPGDPQGQHLCSGETSQTITFLPNATPTSYTWEISGQTGVAGAISLGSSDFIPAQALSTTGNVSGYVTYRVTPSYQGSGTFTCPGGVSYSTIHVHPLPQPSVTGSTLVCELQNGVSYQTPFHNGNTYQWHVTGANLVLNDNLTEVIVNWGTAAGSPGTVTITETVTSTGCQQSAGPVNVTLQQRPVPVITGPLNLCKGSSNHQYSTAAGNSNYSWNITGGTITSGGGTGNHFALVTWDLAGIQNIEVNYVNPLGCEGFPAGSLLVTVNPLPDVTISPEPGTLCEGTNHLFHVPPTAGCSYQWTLQPSSVGTISAATQGTASPSVLWNQYGTATLSVVAENSLTTCTDGNAIQVDIKPSPKPYLTPCFDMQTYNNAKKITLRGASPYDPEGRGKFTGNRVSFNSVTGNWEFDPSGALPGNYNIFYTYENAHGCISTAGPVSISVQNAPVFSCGNSFTDPRDGRSYPTALISGRCWMTTNLNYGTTLSTSPAQPQTDNCIAEKYCFPSDPNCTGSGGYYQWDELTGYLPFAGSKGLCPPGWHIPSSTEWQQMIDNLVPDFPAPHANAITSPILKDSTLSGGFRALLHGVFFSNHTWMFHSGDLKTTLFWTSDPSGPQRGLGRGLNTKTPGISLYPAHRNNAFPVRCIKDQ